MSKNAAKRILIRSWKPLAGIIALILLIVWTTGITRERVSPGVRPHEPGMAMPADASTITIRKQAIPAIQEVMGTITSADNVPLSSRLTSLVEEVLVSAGDTVTNQQLLVRLDDRELRQQLADAEAQARQAESEYHRMRKLVESGAATRQQFVASEAAHASAQARVDQIRVLLTYTEIRAPIPGIVTDRLTEPGMLVHPGQTILSVYNPELMRLDVPVPARLIPRISIQQTVLVQLDTGGAAITGTVSEIVSEIDTRSRTRVVKVRLDGGSHLVPGSFGRLVVELDPRDGYLVPASSIMRVGQLEMVHVVRNDRVVRQLIKTGPARNGMLEVLSGLNEEDVILTRFNEETSR